MFSKVEELTEPSEEVIESINPSRFDSKYIKGTIVVPGILALVVTAAVIGSALNFVSFGSPGIFAAFYILPVALFIFHDLKRYFVMYHFTDEQIIEEDGILNKDINTMHYEKITHATLNQDFEERIFSVSDIEIDSAGEAGTELILNGVRNAGKYKNLIDEKAFNDGQQQQNQLNDDRNNNFNKKNLGNNSSNQNNQGRNNFDNNNSSQQF